MRLTAGSATIVAALLAAVAPVWAQSQASNTPSAQPSAAASPSSATASPSSATAAAQGTTPDESWKTGRTVRIQYSRPLDKRGLNVFETTKKPGAEFSGFRLDFGAAFASQLQNLSHSNTADSNIVNGVNANQLQSIGMGFNNSTANAVMHAQLAPGIRVQLTSYLSARHHNETWVKDGFIQIDELPMKVGPLNKLFEVATVRIGHMEINYGDAHFRRSDNGNAIYNPFVGNYIMDAFTTEIGGELYLKSRGVIAMASVTAGELRGTVVSPEQRGPSFIGKLGIDRQIARDFRVRVTGSLYNSNRAISNTLYSGDRAGSRYYWVLENTTATESANYTSGAINPGFRNEVRAFQMNPFVKYRGLELFGVLERSDGKAAAEPERRVWKQYALDTVYRFMPDESLFVGVRYNRVVGAATGIAGDVGANRWQAGGGWFITPHLLAKAEYVNQKYFGYPPANIRNGGTFHGMMLEGVVGF